MKKLHWHHHLIPFGSLMTMSNIPSQNMPKSQKHDTLLISHIVHCRSLRSLVGATPRPGAEPGEAWLVRGAGPRAWLTGCPSWRSTWTQRAASTTPTCGPMASTRRWVSPNNNNFCTKVKFAISIIKYTLAQKQPRRCKNHLCTKTSVAAIYHPKIK